MTAQTRIDRQAGGLPTALLGTAIAAAVAVIALALALALLGPAARPTAQGPQAVGAPAMRAERHHLVATPPLDAPASRARHRR
jgi:hypothetical protein